MQPRSDPIEQAFAKLEHWMRTAASRSRDTLWRATGTILDRFTLDECQTTSRMQAMLSSRIEALKFSTVDCGPGILMRAVRPCGRSLR